MFEIVVLLLLTLSLLVAGLLQYFGDYRKLPWYALLVGFLAWLFPMSLPVILPLDLASTHYRKCVGGGSSNGTMDVMGGVCDKPLAYVTEEFLLVYWKTVYWTMFCLTWFTIPIMQSWIRAGEFHLGRRLWAAVKDNLIYWAILGSVGAVFLIYILIIAKFDKDSLLLMGIAAANAWGLLLSTVMMGYGLVEIPRTLWFDANMAWCLRYAEFSAPGVKENMVDAEADLFEAVREIAVVGKRVEPDHPLRPFVDKLLSKCPLALQERNLDTETLPSPIDQPYLTSLHSRIKRAVKVLARTQAQYQFLLLKAYWYQDVIENYKSRDRRFVSPFLDSPPTDRFRDLKLRGLWWWYVHLRPIALRSLSLVSMGLSLALIWSESTFQIESPVLSIPAVILKSPYIGYVALELVAFAMILYMCICAYSTLFKIKFFDYYLVPEHHTDEGSLLFIGNYLCKLTFPLCYNFLNMVTDDETAFVTYQGKAVKLTPLLGEAYNTWLPEIVLVFALITLTNLHGRLLRLCKVKYYSYYDAIGEGVEEVDEGRGIIEQARAVEERRRLNPSAPQSRFSTALAATTSSSSSTPARSSRYTGNSSTTQSIIAKYKAGRRGGREDIVDLEIAGAGGDIKKGPNPDPPSLDSTQKSWFGSASTALKTLKKLPITKPPPPAPTGFTRLSDEGEENDRAALLASTSSSRPTTRKFGKDEGIRNWADDEGSGSERKGQPKGGNMFDDI
ncbi:LMBR1-like membrane protein-domain-containing protein [Phlyctochytrium arcticum]|nr:LMBR1-like membrane protein-domain-containing protein [Phlyctochytrium arcticum]